MTKLFEEVASAQHAGVREAGSKVRLLKEQSELMNENGVLIQCELGAGRLLDESL